MHESFDTARPRYTLPLGDKEYDLVGTFRVIENVEYVMKRGFARVAIDVPADMTTVDLVKLIVAILKANDHKVTESEIADILWNQTGLSGEAISVLKLHIYSFMSICLAAPPDREKAIYEAGELLRGLKNAMSSHGSNTSEPV